MSSYSYEPLSSTDRTFLDLESPSTHMHVAATAIFETATLANADGGVDIDRLRDYVASRLDLLPRYRQKLDYIPIEGHPVWVDDPFFNIAYHVRHSCLPRPGSRDQLRSLSGRIMSQQLDRAKPLWEFWVVEGLDGGERFAIIHKAHHCMIDGMAGVDLMAVLLGPTPVERFDAASPAAARPVPGFLDLLRDETVRRLSSPLALAKEAPAVLADPMGFAEEVGNRIGAVAEALGSTLQSTSKTPWNTTIGPHRRLEWLDMDLHALKAVKDELGGTLNDVVLATVAGALRAFLIRRGEDPDNLTLRANVPVSLRAENEHGAMGNRIAIWMTDLPVQEPDPVGRLDEVRRTTRRLKASRRAMGAEVLASVSDMTTSTLLSLAVRISTSARPFNLVVTNVPGPQLPLYMLGSRLTEIYPMVNLLPGQGMAVALFSYNGRIYWGLIGDWDVLGDLDEFGRDIRASFGELYDLAMRTEPLSE